MTEPATTQSQEPMRVAYQAVIDSMAQVNANTDATRAGELRDAAARAMDEYDRLVAEERLRQRQATIDSDAQARDAARRIAAGPGNDIARGDAPSDDNVMTLSDRRERSRLIYRHYFMEEELSESDQVRMHRQTNEERQFWMAMRQPDKYAAINFPHLRVDPFPTDDVLRRAHNGQSYAGLMTGEGAPDEGRWEGDAAQVRAATTTQQVGTNADGGFLVPEGFQAELIRAMKAYGPLNNMRIVRVMPTAMGNPVKWPGMDDTGNKGALIGEHVDAAYTTVGFSQIELNAYKYTTKAFAVTREAIQDTALPIQEIVRDAAAERVGRILNEHFTSADGSSKPQGVMTGAGITSQTINMTTAATLTLNDTLRVIHHIDPAYRQRRCRFMLNDNTALAYHQLVDGNTRYYFAPDVRDATRLRLFGYTVEINQDMDSIAAGKNAIIFGDFQKFLVRMVRGLTIRRLDEILALSDQVAFVGFMRCDSRVLDHRAFCVLDSDAA